MKDLTDRLMFVCDQEGVQAEPAAISAIARMADGGFRDALTLLEQAIIVSDGQISVDVVYDQLGLVSEQAVDELLVAIQIGEVAKIITLLEEIVRTGRDPRSLLESMLHRLADLTRAVYQVPNDGVDSTREASLHEIAVRLGKPFLISVRASLADAHKIIRDISLPKLWLESELIRIATVGTQAPAPAAAPIKKAEPKVEAPKAEAVAVVQTPEPVKAQELTKEKVVTEEAKPASNSSSDARAESNDWDRLWNALPVNPKTGGATMHKMKLSSATLVEDTGDRLIVAVERQMDLDWFNENPGRIKFVSDQLATIGREGTIFELILEKKNDLKLVESEAVELHVDGTRLERLVKEVFNLTDTKEEDLG